MAGKVYFGNKNFQTWIDAPQSGMKASSQGYVNEQALLSGRTYVKRSSGSHRVFNASWLGGMNNATLADGLQVIKSFADGLYGAGPYYWNDPYAMDKNLMPPHWASPMLGEFDWPLISTSTTFSVSFPLTNNNNGYPYKIANYTLGDSSVGNRKVTILIPPGYTFWFGWHSSVGGESAATTGGVRITRYIRATGLADTTFVNPTAIAAGSTTSVNTSISGTTYSYVEIYLANGDTAPDNIFINSMIAQVLINGTTPTAAGFIPGKGTTGLEFSSFPEIEYYSSAINSGQIGLSASLTEI